MQRALKLLLLIAGIACLSLWARDCSNLPTQFTGGEYPNGNFFTNFDNECFLIPFSVGSGGGGAKGDLNSIYNKIYFNNNPAMPPYELIIIGQFPNARYFSITVYDNHSAVSRNLTDVNIVPLSPGQVNPYQTGVPYVSGQQYAVPINLGGTPGAIEPGCSMTGYNVDVNALDGTQRHPFMNWNLDPAFVATNPPQHEVDTPNHTSPNPAGAIFIRSYLNMAGYTGPQPHIIVRDVASGCAYPSAFVNSSMNAVTNNPTIGSTWLHKAQSQEHNYYETWLGSNCWGAIPTSSVQWSRGPEYTSGGNPDAAYSYASIAEGLPQSLFDAGEVARMRFRVATAPPTPCTSGCTRSGDEQMRYMSVSFQANGGMTMASLPDHCPTGGVMKCTPLVQDSNGYVTLVVSTGVPQPAWVNSANGYTWVDLSKSGISNYMQWNQIAIRDILASQTFACPASFVPYRVAQATTSGAGIMGLYAPVVDYPVAASLPTAASPLTGPSTCDVFPDGNPNQSPSCKVLAAPPISIASVTTQRTASKHGTFVLGPQPALSISGAGFGSFPQGLPFVGNSNYLEITDTTQLWSAGYTGNTCNVNLGEWSNTFISMVANVNQGGACPLVSGDQIAITVWNPQTMSSTTYNTTVTAP